MSAHSRPHRRRSRLETRRLQWDHRLVAVVVFVCVLLLAIAVYSLDPGGPIGWSWQTLMLCALVGAIAGRALLGLRQIDAQTEDRQSSRSCVVVWAALIGAAVLPNLHTLSIGFLADDYGLLGTARAAAGPLDAIRFVPLRLFHRPVSELLWWTGVHLWGGSALGYHLLSVVLHTGNTALLFLLARRYTGSAYGGAMAALLFAVHPFHVEATTWAAAQPDLLCLLFCLLSLWCLESYLESPARWRRGLALAGALISFALALYSKEAAMAFPGVAFLRLVVVPQGRRLLRAAAVTAAFASVLAAYLALRFLMLGEDWLVGYRPSLDFWNTIFPSMPLRMVTGFFFPVHQGLFSSLSPPYLLVAALVAMALGLLWWILNLDLVPSRRIAFALGYLAVFAIPVWTLSYGAGADMMQTRYAYLPSVGLALLFGEIHARRHGPWRQRSLVGGTFILAAAGLSIWYATSWRQAARLRDDVLAAGARTVAALPVSLLPSTVLIRGLPSFYRGAPVFVNSYGLALTPLLSRPVAIQEVSSTPSSLEAAAVSDLRPGEYLLSWDGATKTMNVERAGATAGEPPPGAPP